MRLVAQLMTTQVTIATVTHPEFPLCFSPVVQGHFLFLFVSRYVNVLEEALVFDSDNEHLQQI